MRDTIEMAREAGLLTWLKPPEDVIERFKAFEALVRADERAQPAPVQELVAQSLKDAVFTVIEGFNIPHDVRKILESAYYNTPPAPQPVPVKTYHDGKPWPVQPAPDPAPIIQQLVTALEGSGTRMRSDQWYIKIEAVAAGKFYLNSKGANHD
jgi:hypothetical protein